MGNKVLIVEDDPNLLETLKYNLWKESYDVVTAVDGDQALEIARNEKPDLIIVSRQGKCHLNVALSLYSIRRKLVFYTGNKDIPVYLTSRS
jgi:DNA-binding response OmpR family regulator